MNLQIFSGSSIFDIFTKKHIENQYVFVENLHLLSR